MRERVLTSRDADLSTQAGQQRLPDIHGRKSRTLRPVPFAYCSKVSLTWPTRSRVGSNTSARSRVTTRCWTVYSRIQW